MRCEASSATSFANAVSMRGMMRSAYVPAACARLPPVDNAVASNGSAAPTGARTSSRSSGAAQVSNECSLSALVKKTYTGSATPHARAAVVRRSRVTLAKASICVAALGPLNRSQLTQTTAARGAALARPSAAATRGGRSERTIRCQSAASANTGPPASASTASFTSQKLASSVLRGVSVPSGTSPDNNSGSVPERSTVVDLQLPSGPSTSTSGLASNTPRGRRERAADTSEPTSASRLSVAAATGSSLGRRYQSSAAAAINPSATRPTCSATRSPSLSCRTAPSNQASSTKMISTAMALYQRVDGLRAMRTMRAKGNGARCVRRTELTCGTMVCGHRPCVAWRPRSPGW